jgi:alkanesulfonate monooxygenase SsuD/methylene tetrahydromethanopterin reductase-like flavin-dependent oxidoreductase (luciferase family)
MGEGSVPFRVSVWTDGRDDPADPDPSRRFAELLEEARVADALGFRGFWTSEQHGVDDGYLGSQLTLLAAVGAVTSRIRLMTNVVVLPFYRWRLLAEAVVVADLISGGRIELGLGAGAYGREFALFGVDPGTRARLMEEGVSFLRRGLVEGRLADGPDGEPIPLTPRPARPSIPILLGGLSRSAVARAVRLADGHLAYDFADPERNLPRHWSEIVRPELERVGRSLEGFRFVAALPLWISEDPERDWEVLFRPAFSYQQRRYREWADTWREPGMISPERAERSRLIVDTPEGAAGRLLAIWRSAPWHELGFWYRLPGIPHDRALEHLATVASRLMPLLGAGSARA